MLINLVHYYVYLCTWNNFAAFLDCLALEQVCDKDIQERSHISNEFYKVTLNL